MTSYVRSRRPTFEVRTCRDCVGPAGSSEIETNARPGSAIWRNDPSKERHSVSPATIVMPDGPPGPAVSGIVMSRGERPEWATQTIGEGPTQIVVALALRAANDATATNATTTARRTRLGLPTHPKGRKPPILTTSLHGDG